MAKMRKLFLVLGATLCVGIATKIVPASAQQIDRTQLTIPDTKYKYPGKVPLDARDAKFPPIKLLRPPEGAPNVVVILLDDTSARRALLVAASTCRPLIHWRSRGCATRSFIRRRCARRLARPC